MIVRTEPVEGDEEYGRCVFAARLHRHPRSAEQLIRDFLEIGWRPRLVRSFFYGCKKIKASALEYGGATLKNLLQQIAVRRAS